MLKEEEIKSLEDVEARRAAVESILRARTPKLYAAARQMLLPNGALVDGEDSPRERISNLYKIGEPPQTEEGVYLPDPYTRPHTHFYKEDFAFLLRQRMPVELIAALCISSFHAPCAEDFSASQQLGFVKKAAVQELGITRGLFVRRKNHARVAMLSTVVSQLGEFSNSKRQRKLAAIHMHHDM